MKTKKTPQWKLSENIMFYQTKTFFILYLPLLLLSACNQKVEKKEKYERFIQTLNEHMHGYKAIRSPNLFYFKDQVMKEGNSQERREALKRTNILYVKTSKLLSKIENLNKIIDTISTEKQNQFLISEYQKGEAYILVAWVNEYIKTLNRDYQDIKIVKEDLPLIGADSLTINFINQSNSKNLGYVEMYFKDVSKEKILIQLNLIRKIICSYETKIAEQLNFTRYSHSFIDFFGMPVVDASETYYVRIGDDYHAKMCLGHPKIPYVFELSSKISSDYQKESGVVDFVVDKTGEQYWKGNISWIKDPFTEEVTTIEISRKYYVLAK